MIKAIKGWWRNLFTNKEKQNAFLKALADEKARDKWMLHDMLKANSEGDLEYAEELFSRLVERKVKDILRKTK